MDSNFMSFFEEDDIQFDNDFFAEVTIYPSKENVAR